MFSLSHTLFTHTVHMSKLLQKLTKIRITQFFHIISAPHYSTAQSIRVQKLFINNQIAYLTKLYSSKPVIFLRVSFFEEKIYSISSRLLRKCLGQFIGLTFHDIDLFSHLIIG